MWGISYIFSNRQVSQTLYLYSRISPSWASKYLLSVRMHTKWLTQDHATRRAAAGNRNPRLGRPKPGLPHVRGRRVLDSGRMLRWQVLAPGLASRGLCLEARWQPGVGDKVACVAHRGGGRTQSLMQSSSLQPASHGGPGSRLPISRQVWSPATLPATGRATGLGLNLAYCR